MPKCGSGEKKASEAKAKTNTSNKRTSTHAVGMPKAPRIFLNDACHSNTDIAYALVSMIPDSVVMLLETPVFSPGVKPAYHVVSPNVEVTGCVCVFATNFTNICAAEPLVKSHREGMINKGINFVSINVHQKRFEEDEEEEKKVSWGVNHLNIVATGDAKADAENIFKWLFKVLSVRETLYLIPEAEMLAVDNKNYPDYKYCAIADTYKQGKDAKIQFVALITSKPFIGPDRRLSWTVADRTGIANFYFRHRGPSSDYTWDWVLSLNVGDRKALPRMPSVLVRASERVHLTALKLPLRIAGGVIGGTGVVVRGLGKGMVHVGRKIGCRKPADKWVPEADVLNGAYDDIDNTTAEANPEAKMNAQYGYVECYYRVFNAQGENMWKAEADDGDESASTVAGSICDEKLEKNLV